MKILFINNLYSPNVVGGAERTVQFIAESMGGAGYRAVVLSAAPGKDVRVEEVNGVQVYYIGLKNLFWPFPATGDLKPGKPLWASWYALDMYNIWMAREVARIVDIERPNLIHTHNLFCFSTLVWQLAKQRGLPLVHTIHDYYLLCGRSTMFRNGKNCQPRCSACRLCTLPKRYHSSSYVDSVVGVSHSVLERHLNNGYFASSAKKQVIYNSYGVTSDIQSSNARSLPIRFGYLGRIGPDKGVEVLLNAVAYLPKASWNLMIGGRGNVEYERYLRAKYESPAIKFLGIVQPADFFPEVDVLVVPSLWHDPSPRVVSEANAYGVPVIGSNRGGIPELIEEGRTGFIFDPNRSEDLLTNMQRFVDTQDIASVMRVACLRRAKSMRPESIFEQYLEVYDDTLGIV